MNTNPFATRWTKPGELPYLGGPDEGLDGLLVELVRRRGWGQIIGPHGSGKSTLLVHLHRTLEGMGQCVRRYQLHEHDRAFSMRAEARTWSAGTQVMVDGFEQLSCWSRWRLRLACWRLGCGLLVTAHTRQFGMPLLLRTASSLDLAWEIVQVLLRHHRGLMTRDDVRAAFECCRGNMRETLFHLYDLAEQRRSSSGRARQADSDP